MKVKTSENGSNQWVKAKLNRDLCFTTTNTLQFLYMKQGRYLLAYNSEQVKSSNFSLALNVSHFVTLFFFFFSIWNLKGHFPMILPSSSVFAEAEWNKIWLSWKDVGRIQSVCLFCACKSFDPVSEGCSDLMLFRLISLPSSPGELSL